MGAVFRQVMDQMGRSVRVSAAPRRIVSLVPSQTELLFDLGVGERVVGVTKFCIHPTEARKAATVIGGTKHFDFEKIAALQPDLIIGNKEENYREGIAKLAADYPVWMSDIVTLPDAVEMIRTVGELVQVTDVADTIASAIEADFATLHHARSGTSRYVRAAYLIWREPWMAAGAGTFIHEMLRAAGFVNVFDERTRYPEITAADFAAARPDVVLLSSEPYPFREKHVAEIASLYPGARVELVDGEVFSWYGSRLRHTPTYLTALHRRLA